jgi:hypothetical protein
MLDAAPSPTPDTAPAAPTDVAPVPDAAASDASDAPASTADAADATNDGSSDSTSGDALMDLFRDGTPDQIADRLEASVDSRPDQPKMIPVYKGVAFPAWSA